MLKPFHICLITCGWRQAQVYPVLILPKGGEPSHKIDRVIRYALLMPIGVAIRCCSATRK